MARDVDCYPIESYALLVLEMSACTVVYVRGLTWSACDRLSIKPVEMCICKGRDEYSARPAFSV